MLSIWNKDQHCSIFRHQCHGCIRPFSSDNLPISNLQNKKINYTGCTQCATPKLPKKVLHIGDIVAHWGHSPGKMGFFEKHSSGWFPYFRIIFSAQKKSENENARKKSQFNNQKRRFIVARNTLFQRNNPHIKYKILNGSWAVHRTTMEAAKGENFEKCYNIKSDWKKAQKNFSFGRSMSAWFWNRTVYKVYGCLWPRSTTLFENY